MEKENKSYSEIMALKEYYRRDEVKSTFSQDEYNQIIQNLEEAIENIMAHIGTRDAFIEAEEEKSEESDTSFTHRYNEEDTLAGHAN